MKKLAVLAAAGAAALSVAGIAQAGCMATVGIAPLVKDGQPAGAPWLVTVRVLQHGRTPMSDARPVVRIRSSSGKLIRFRTTPGTRIGSYRARVVFPTAGTWRVAVYDGFPVKECAQIHTFGSVEVVAY